MTQPWQYCAWRESVTGFLARFIWQGHRQSSPQSAERPQPFELAFPATS